MFVSTTSTAFFTSFFQGPAGLDAYLSATPAIDLQRIEEARGIVGAFQKANPDDTGKLNKAISMLWKPLNEKDGAGANGALKGMAEALRSLDETQYADIAGRAKMGVVFSAIYFAGDTSLSNAIGEIPNRSDLQPSSRTTFLVGASFILSGDVDLQRLIEASQRGDNE
ncbi:MAG: hypothetical protein Q8P84_05745, partial [Deltaproteobacteria bacterium]|nr:hypothetical protein [Deltaproteobacteria bacterium]